MPLEGHDISWWELHFWAICGMCHVLCCVPIWRVHYSKPGPPMDLILCKPLLHTPYSQLLGLTFVKGSLCGDPEAMRWEQGVCFTIFHIFMCPLGK